MRLNKIKAALSKTGLAASVLLAASGAAIAQSVDLTATPTQAVLPDGQAVPMWGYTCGMAPDPITTLPVSTASGNATCNALNPNAAGNWSPVIITAPANSNLHIHLTNALSFLPPNQPAGTAPTLIPTSLVIVGQLGGGLGGGGITTPSPAHAPYGTTWPGTSGPADPTSCPDNGGSTGTFCGPAQTARTQSFATEVAVSATATDLVWNNLRPGTYLIESGTHPSIQGPMGLYGVLVVTQPATAATSSTSATQGTAYPGVNYDAEVPLLLSEIDAAQNADVNLAVNTVGFAENKVWLGTAGACGDPNVHSCYPPAVNYDPRYYLINGVSFDRTAIQTDSVTGAVSSPSLFPTQPATVANAGGSVPSVLVRFVNAGLRMHVPSIVGAQTSLGLAAGITPASGFSLIAEDGNRLPGVARVQNQVFMAAGKTYDVMINAPAANAPALPVFDRQLSLSTNNQRDGGMLAYIGANGGTPAGTAAATASHNGATFFCNPGVTLRVTDPAKGVLAHETGANGAVLGTFTGANAADALNFKSNGTFTYTPASGSAGCGGTFTYLVNGNVANTATANIKQCDATGTSGCKLAGAPVANDISFTSNNARHFSIAPPGVLAGVTGNSAGLVLTASSASANFTVNADGSFNVDSGGAGSVAFNYQVTNSQGTSSAPAQVTVNFPAGSGLQVHVADAKTIDSSTGAIDYTNGAITDYRWIIEEDRTFYSDPNTTNSGTTVPSLGTNFHAAHMPVVAQGCTGPASCEVGQTWLNPTTGTHDLAVCDQGNGVCRTDTTGTGYTAVYPGDVVLDPGKRYYISILPGDGENATLGGAGGPASGTGGLTQSGGTVTLSSPGGFFGVVIGDKITVSGTKPDGTTPLTADCQVISVTATSLKCTVSPTVGFGAAAAASYANTRTFDIGKDCGAYSTVGGSFWEPGGANAKCGHTMGGATIAVGQSSVNIALQENPVTPAKLSVFVFEDDSPLNGENDAGGGVDVLAPNEPGLEAFNLIILDQGGTLGDSTGQITYDMFNMPVSNSLANRKDPVTGKDACPINQKGTNDSAQAGIVGVIPVCPKYESDGVTLSPLAGQAVIANLYPGLYEIVATPGADRIARGEEWLQTNTLDGTKPIEAFIRPGEPSYFQEFGPGGYHVAIGFANPSIIQSRKGSVCAGAGACNVTINGHVTNLHMSRTPDQRVYSSGDYTADSFTQCYASLGPADGPDFDFAKCDASGQFQFTKVPGGDLRITIFDQWNDLLVDGLSTPITVCDASVPGNTCNKLPTNTTNTNCTYSGTSGATCSYELAVTQWRTNLYTDTFFDKNGDGVRQDDEPGLPLVSTNIRYRDGSIGFFNNTDLAGSAGFNEVFPLLNWLVIETDSTRYKQTGVHVVNDTGGRVDGSGCDGTTATECGGSNIAAGIANSYESPTAHIPASLRDPGTRYCADADCTGTGSFDPNGPGSSGRVDPPWAPGEAWQGLLGLGDFVQFGKAPYQPGENGGIKGHVIYASTRPFDDPQLLLQLSWEPGVPNVPINLYKVGTAADGSVTYTLVDHTTSTSFDDWAQGFRRTPDGSLVGNATDGYVPNMNCPGVETTSPFYFTLQDSTQFLNPTTKVAEHGRFKCFDGWAALNQMQPAPYDGMYKFPSVRAKDATGTEYLELDSTRYGTNCTICKKNADGSWQLPPGKYVVEAVTPPGYEVVKEEDKNILLGDVYIAPVTQQFAGLGNIYILPDQAAVNSHYNANNPGGLNLTDNFGTPRREGDTGSLEQFWPCVGAMRIVPDYNSIFPAAGQQAPFAGASRALCDRKEVVLNDQMSVLAKFYVFSSTHVAGHFTGTITNDFASEFDPFSPQFGEKFAVPNLPVSLRDFNGHEMSRVYSDQWGLYNGMNYSSWDVNPPNPTGYIPQMMIACMNDPGPILDPNGSGAMIKDPHYNPAYSNYCYEIPFMPGQTAYLDTPVIPTMAFADNYNLPDCEYPDSTPGIASVIGNDSPAVGGSSGKGPWVSGSGAAHSLTITSLGANTGGMVDVPNHAYSGPQASTAPFNTRTIKRYYGFGKTAGTVALVGTDGIPHPLENVAWGEFSITATVPANVQFCPVQQQGFTTGNARARCGELVVTNSTGKSSIDAVTVTIGGKAPAYVTPASESTTLFGATKPNPLQRAIDKAAPGDLIIVGPGTYNEVVLMWKPVRLQGVGAASVTINADAHPGGNIDSWRRQVDCLFGLSLNGRPLLNDGTFPQDTYDSTGQYTCPAGMQQRVDRIPFEAIVGWDTSGNGNLAQLLQEPTLMGAYEGAGITVLGRGMRIPTGSRDFWGASNAGGFAAGAVYLTANNRDCATSPSRTDGLDYGTSNFLCNPSRIDGISVINSSQGGGAIFLHAWNHNMEIGNNRISANHGTLTGGITIGNGEFPDPYTVGVDVPYPLNGNGGVYSNAGHPAPANGEQAGYGFNRNVNVHHNSVTANASIGDALYSGTPSAAGGVSFCTGSDFYKFNYNWICGNLSTGDGGGVAHVGMSDYGTIANNSIVFNQSTNPTIPTHGGGLAVLGASPDRTLPNGQECGNTNADADCPPGLPEGTGRGLSIDANVIVGNSAESGSGGGLRLQSVNGQEIGAFPTNPNRWYSVDVTNNIIADNVAGWDGGGVSLQDALKVRFINNTVIANDTTASSGVLFNTLGAVNASTPPPTSGGQSCTPQPDPTKPQDPSCINPIPTSTPQTAGFVTMQHTANLVAALPPAGTNQNPGVVCPNFYGYGSTVAQRRDGTCRSVSLPLMGNDLLWQNRSFYISVGGFGAGTQSQQHLVSLVPLLNQAYTGACVTDGGVDGAGAPAPVKYWDIGVRGDSGPNSPANPAFQMTPINSILSTGSDPKVLHQYCNGSRLPPENGGKGYTAPAGHSETTGLYPVFALNNITPAATVDEGNNWINLGYGPLSLVDPAHDTHAVLGNYGISKGSPAINTAAAIVGNTPAPDHDIYGTVRPQGTGFDIGAVEYTPPPGPAASVSPGTVDFGNVVQNFTATQTLTLSNDGTTGLNAITVTTAAPFSWPAAAAGGTCRTLAAGTLTMGNTCTIVLQFTAPATLGAVTGTATVAAHNAVNNALVTVSGSPVGLKGTSVGPPAMPALSVLDAFTRANANSLGANWLQAPLFGQSIIRVNTNQATAVPFFGLPGYAMWGQATFGAGQAAAFTFVQAGAPLSPATPVSNSSLVLKGTGAAMLQVPQSFVMVRYNRTGAGVADQVQVQYTTNNGGTFTTAATLSLSGTTKFATNDVLTAWVTSAGVVNVYRNGTYIGAAQLPNDPLWTTGGGRIGVMLPAQTPAPRIDNFAGGTVP